jgi:hypothetical protein
VINSFTNRNWNFNIHLARRRVQMTQKQIYRWLGMGTILLSGVIYLYYAPGEFQAAPYLGALFVVYFMFTVFSAAGIQRNELVLG